jgi:uncharacterized protein (TIGR03790 family)
MREAATAVFACALFTLTALPAGAQSAENVAVVINQASPASIRVGEHYVRTRNVPPLNVIRIESNLEEEVSRSVFEKTIEAPIARALAGNSLQDKVLYIVLTRGVPLRIAGTTGLNGTVASVDSELTLLYRRMTGATVPIRGTVENPYFLRSAELDASQRFTHRLYDIYLVSRLDAFTDDEAVALIDRAQSAAPEGQIVLDQRGTGGPAIGDRWLQETAARLRALGMSDRVILETTPSAARDISPVLGYYSWGSNDPANRVRKAAMGFSPGALAATFVSTDARTLQPPPDSWSPSADSQVKASYKGSSQTLVGDLIREGATGVAGYVAEPYLQSTVRPDILFPAYVSGFNLIEAFYLSMPHLSWQTVVIGDPLCAPFVRKALAPSGIEDGIDSRTELPGLFSKRRMATAQAGSMAAAADALAHFLRSEARQAKDDKAGARAALEEATRMSPVLIGAQLRLAGIYEEAGEVTLATDRYRRVLQAQPNNVAALNNLAYSLAIRQKLLAEAKPLAQRAVTLAPNDPTIIDTLAWIEHLSGNEAEALRLLSPAVQKSAGNAEIHFHAAVIYAAMGQRNAAESQLNEASRLDPTILEREDVRELRKRMARQQSQTRPAKL